MSYGTERKVLGGTSRLSRKNLRGEDPSMPLGIAGHLSLDAEGFVIEADFSATEETRVYVGTCL